MKAVRINRREKPIFIVGMPRTGSTLVEQILSQHPLLKCYGEINNLTKLLEDPSSLDTSDRSGLSSLGSRYLQSVMQGSSRRSCNKKLYNFFYIGVIATIFPEAKIVNVNRDPSPDYS